MMKYFSSRYQRHKRIKRILSLNNGYEGYQPRHRSSEGFLFPRYTWLRFFFTLLGMIIFAVPFSRVFDILFSVMGFKVKILILTPFMMAFGFIIVEVVDEIFLDLERRLEQIRHALVPILAVFFLATVYIAVKYPTDLKSVFGDWRESVNDQLQSKPTLVTITPEFGVNWRFVYEKSQYLKHLTLEEALLNCRTMGTGWHVYDGDVNFRPDPKPIFDRAFYVWMNSHGAQLEMSGIQPPKVYVSANEKTKMPVLCVNKKVSK